MQACTHTERQGGIGLASFGDSRATATRRKHRCAGFESFDADQAFSDGLATTADWLRDKDKVGQHIAMI